MLLALDIGNTSIKGGLFDGATLARTFRLGSPLMDAGALMLELAEQLQGQKLNRAGISSVVPRTVPALRAAVESVAGLAPILIHAGLPLPFELCYETPETLGADRLAAAAAGWVLFGAASQPPRPVVVIDAGTAINYEVVRPPGAYLGGSIAPGPALLMESLARGTAQLPPVPLEMPPEIIGRSTRAALQAGIMAGCIDGARGMLRRIEARLGERPYVVSTGGWSPLLKAHMPEIDHLEPDLVLHGVRILIETADTPAPVTRV
ncbi:MAG TPA: type III pantothenate kinase [Rhodothermales bacterium]|nr:type III pantothenate kinase [Rhodothermales bacterium]